MKKMLLTALVSTVALGTVGIGFTMAQGATLSDTEVVTADTEVAVDNTTAVDDDCMMGRGRGAGMGFEKMLDQKAEMLKLTVDELQAKLDEGKTFIEIAEEQGVTYTDIQSNMNAQFEENLQARIDSGFYTEEQAEQLRAQHEENSGNMHGMGMGNGMGKRNGGMHF
ncbi:MAG: hypothetical protein WCW66_02035 [Patescibacteria group bacterium]|jgi:ribose 5-phosphate isomerase